MRIFISQSGPRSLAIATELAKLVRQLVPGTEPWLSPTGIDKGSRWAAELAKSLNESVAGLVCLTPENLNANWILFEAGALSRHPEGRVWTFLLDVEESQLNTALNQFQNTKALKEDILLMLHSMNRVVGGLRKEADTEALFDLCWPALEAKIAEIRSMPGDAAVAPRSKEEILVEVLATMREMSRQTSKDSWRTMKCLAILHQLYSTAVGSAPPSLKNLLEMQQAQQASRNLSAALLENMALRDASPDTDRTGRPDE